ncbi:MAG: hypothetical protein KatS3mg027_1618 [Bacteroidia bacterium]|nr:MAG: hypothetical protein KatS3mg027_1618 [Bacteroidia bacterium]
MKTNKFNLFYRYYFLILFILTLSSPFMAQLNVTLKYKKAKCGGAKSQDTTSIFLLSNKKWILEHPNKKIDTIYTDDNGTIKLSNKKGQYKLYEPWKFYKQTPSDYPIQFYDKKCLQKAYQNPDFTIIVSSKKRFKLSPQYYLQVCPDKHPCLRTDTIIPRIPRQ